jgi:hypothetical protein
MKMESPVSPAPVREGRWTSLWVVALFSLLAQLALCQFFTFGDKIPTSIDIEPSNLWKFAYHFPPTGTFQVLNWLGVPLPAAPLNPLSLAADHFTIWLFFTAYAPIIATCALIAMAAFLREFGLTRPAALFGGVIFAWQGDILTFVYPGHYGYITSWPFFAMAAWGALRSERTGHWAYAVVSGASCGTMVGLLTNADRGAIASLLIAILYLAPVLRLFAGSQSVGDCWKKLSHLALCVLVAALVALAPLFATFKGFIVGVKIAGTSNPEENYKLVTQYSLGPAETLTYLAPGFFGWHINHADGPYWGWIGEWPDYAKNGQGVRNMNLAISTTGTVAALLALIGIILVLPGKFFGPSWLTPRQRFFGRVLLLSGFVALILSWGWHTPLYRPLLLLPLMDKWRDPLKWLEMTNFAVVVLSAVGLQQLFVSLDAAAPEIQLIRERLAHFTFAILIALLLLLAASYPFSAILASVLQAEKFDPLSIANVMSTMHNSVFVALLVAALLCIVLRLLWTPEKLRLLTLVNPMLHRAWQRMLQPDFLPLTLALSLAVLSAFQLGWVASQFIEPAPLTEFTDSNPLLEALRSERDVRVSVDVTDPILNSLLQNQFSAMGISCLDVSAASRIPDDLNTYFDTLDKDQARLWFLAGVKNVAIPETRLPQMQADPGIASNIDNANGYTLAPTGSPDLPSHALVGMKDYLAKATLVPSVEYLENDGAVLKRLKDPAWKPRESILINKNDPGQKLFAAKSPPTDEQMKTFTPGPGSLELKDNTPTEMKIDVQAGANGGYVLINDQYDPDWQVEVDGQPAELLRADYIMRAIQVQPGHSAIVMRYVPHYRVGNLNLNARAINLLSDTVLLAAFLIAAFVLWPCDHRLKTLSP